MTFTWQETEDMVENSKSTNMVQPNYLEEGVEKETLRNMLYSNGSQLTWENKSSCYMFPEIKQLQ